MPEKKNHYTVMFLPDDNGRTFSIRLHKNIFRSLVAFLALFSLGIVVLLFSMGAIGIKLQLVQTLRQQKQALELENQRLRNAFQKIRKLEVLSEYLHQMSLDGLDQAKLAQFQIQHQAGTPDRGGAAAKQTGDSAQAGAENELAENAAVPHRDYAALIPTIPPLEGWVTKSFSSGSTGRDDHPGIDIAAASGTPIRSTAPGIVETVANDTYFGLLVTIRHQAGFVTRYGHCSQILVNKGDDIKRGQTIGLVGSTGRSTAPHLHYEILRDGKSLDPKEFMFLNMYD
jgi:murein DD-endopeptidase MepM/ murein hydrolase activator NlpD